MQTTHDDLAQRAHVLRTRIFKDERAYAIAYPEERERLAADLERERAELAELDSQVEEAKDEVRRKMIAAADAFFDARATLVRLNGHLIDPGFPDPFFMKVGMGAEPTQDALSVKAALLRALDMPRAKQADVPEGQRLHDERLRNERAGVGYFTDDELRRKADDPVAFAHGHGARLSRRNTLTSEA